LRLISNSDSQTGSLGHESLLQLRHVSQAAQTIAAVFFRARQALDAGPPVSIDGRVEIFHLHQLPAT
jgi:hypothetical protein